MMTKAEQLMRKYGYGYIHSKKLLNEPYVEDLQKEIDNKNNEIDCLKDQVEWWKQQCDDLEMQIGMEE